MTMDPREEVSALLQMVEIGQTHSKQLAKVITHLRAQLEAAEADKMAAMERVREAAVKRVKLLLLGRSRVVEQQITKAILALDLDALAEGEK